MDCLGTAEMKDRCIFDDRMTAFFKIADDKLWETGLHSDIKIFIDPPAGRIAGGLGVLFIAKDPNHHLYVALGLHAAAHDPETHQGPVIPGDKSRNNGLKRALGAGNTVGVVFIQYKAVAPVLHGDAGIRNYNARSKAQIVGLDEGDHHTALICGRQVDGSVIGGHD